MKNYNLPKTIKPDASQANSNKPKPQNILKYIDLVNKNYGNEDVKIKSDAHYERLNPRAKKAPVEPTIERTAIGTIKNFDKPKPRFDLWNEIKKDKDPQNIAEVRQLVNNHVKSVGHTKLLTPDEFKYLDKNKKPTTEDKPFKNDPYLAELVGKDWPL